MSSSSALYMAVGGKSFCPQSHRKSSYGSLALLLVLEKGLLPPNPPLGQQ